MRKSIPPSNFVRTHEKYILRDQRFTQQYSHMYYVRLDALRQQLEDAALAQWSMKEEEVVRVLGLVPGRILICAGCICKESAQRPSFLKDYTREIVANVEVEVDEEGDAAADVEAMKTSETQDKLLLEDESGRVELECKPEMVNTFVTGVTVAVRGRVDGTSGKFVVLDWMTIPIPFDESIPREPLLPASNGPCYIAFVSGLNIGDPILTPHKLQILEDFLTGISAGVSSVVVQSIARVVICGNSVCNPAKDQMRTRLRLDIDETKQNRDDMSRNLARLDSFLAAVTKSVPVDLMSGATDPTNIFLPQQPMHPVLLKTSSHHSTLSLVTNPYEFSIIGSSTSNNNKFVGTSGQNVDDIVKYTQGVNDLDALEMILKCRHLCPTAPDTLCTYPFIDKDPYLIHDSAVSGPPRLLFAGNRSVFATKVVCGSTLLCVPSYSSTGTLVLVDVSSPNLDVLPVSIE
eukprot:PhF_6_TR31385/c0_g1_i1/m.45967/K02328/POLD2; DNA polymerase delta subunit 2